jgi:hypothetical protein
MYTDDELLYGLAKCLEGEDIKFKDPFEDLGTWRLINMISEKTCRDYQAYPFEAVTVYICERVDGEDAGQRAIMKIRAQYVLLEEIKSGDSNDCSRIPGTNFSHSKKLPIPKSVNKVTENELYCLETLTEAGCTSTPRLLGFERRNRKDKWLPKGYIVYILMQMVPGVSLEDFWRLPREERDQARKAFRTALE